MFKGRDSREVGCRKFLILSAVISLLCGAGYGDRRVKQEQELNKHGARMPCLRNFYSISIVLES